MDLQFAPQAAEILRFLSSCPEKKCGIGDLDKRFPNSEDWIDKLVTAGYIVGDDMQMIGNSQFGITSYRLLPEGEIAISKLEQHKDQLKQKAKDDSKQERQQRFDNRMQILNLFMSIISFVGGIIVEHYVNIYGAIASAFDWIGSRISSLPSWLDQLWNYFS